MDRYTDLEWLLGGLLLATAIALIILWIKNNALKSLVVLQPKKDKLKVKYFWLDEEFQGEPTVKDLIEPERDYEYLVEGTEILVSKEESFLITSQTMETDEFGNTARIGGIRPPTVWRRPPAKLMAIEISVAE